MIEIKGISKSFEGHKAVDDVSVTIKENTVATNGKLVININKYLKLSTSLGIVIIIITAEKANPTIINKYLNNVKRAKDN